MKDREAQNGGRHNIVFIARTNTLKLSCDNELLGISFPFNHYPFFMTKLPRGEGSVEHDEHEINLQEASVLCQEDEDVRDKYLRYPSIPQPPMPVVTIA